MYIKLKNKMAIDALLNRMKNFCRECFFYNVGLCENLIYMGGSQISVT